MRDSKVVNSSLQARNVRRILIIVVMKYMIRMSSLNVIKQSYKVTRNIGNSHIRLSPVCLDANKIFQR